MSRTSRHHGNNSDILRGRSRALGPALQSEEEAAQGPNSRPGVQAPLSTREQERHERPSQRNQFQVHGGNLLFRFIAYDCEPEAIAHGALNQVPHPRQRPRPQSAEEQAEPPPHSGRDVRETPNSLRL